MKGLLLENNKDALVIVAHPDDETIWMGGTILGFKNLNWTVFSLCRASDPDRAPKFKKVCRHYGAQGIIADFEDQGLMGVEESVPKIEKIIAANFARKKFAYIFTHGPNGEYGHERHLGVHLAAKKLVKKKIIICDRLFFFAYKLNSDEKIVNLPEKSVDFVFKLDYKKLKTKKNIIKNLYGFSKKSFENISCLPEETFNIL